MSRLLFALRLRYGLRWPGRLPRIDWSALLDVAVIVMLLLGAYALVSANDERAAAGIRQSQATQMLADCLANRAVFWIDDHAAKCELTWIRMGGRP